MVKQIETQAGEEESVWPLITELVAKPNNTHGLDSQLAFPQAASILTITLSTYMIQLFQL